MEQPEDNTVYENETSECKEGGGNSTNPNFSGFIINKESIDVDVEDQDSSRSSIFSEYRERKERRQSKSSIAKDSIGEDDESNYDNPDIESPNPRMDRRRSSVLSDYQERKERLLKESRQSRSSVAIDSIGEDDESKYDNTDIENPNPRMDRRRSSVFSDYQERKERFANSKGSIIKDSVGENEDTDDVVGSTVEGTTPRTRMERRQSSIFSIVQNANIETVTAPKPKPCIPPKVEITLLTIFVIVCLVVVWITILPLAGSDVYQGLVTRRLRNIPQNLSLPSIRLLSRLNLSNLSVECPEMFIFSHKDNSCKPRCGAWSGCGISMYYVERYSIIIIDTVGIIVGIFGVVSWLLDYKHWVLRHFAIVFSTQVAFISSIAFALLDLPGSKYLFCSNEDKPFEDVAGEDRLHIQVYAAAITFLNISFLFWLWFSLVNISLVAFFPLSLTLQKKSFCKKLLVGESIFAWGIPLCIIGLFTAAGGRFNLGFAIQHPTSNGAPPNFILSIPFYILFRMIISTFLIIFIKIRFQIIKSQKYSSKRIKISSLEKRFIAIGELYVALILLRSMYSSWIGFSLKWELQNEGFAACVTLGSSFTTTHRNTTMSIFNNTSIVADLLPLPLKNIVPECTYPCILPLRTILLRLIWIIIFSITSLHPIYSVFSRCSNRWRGHSANTKSTTFTNHNQSTLKDSCNSKTSLGVSRSFNSSN